MNHSANDSTTDPATTTVNTCPTWCLRHEPNVEDLCIGPAVELDFGQAHPDNPQGARDARILSYNEPGGVTLSLVVNGTESFDMNPTQARQIGMALIQAADNATVADVTGGRHLMLVTGGAR